MITKDFSSIKANDADIWKFQVANVCAYVFQMFMSFSKDTRYRMSEIVYEWRIAINPAGPAFAIWGIIYMFDLMFVIYQALPQSWEPTRDNNLIYGQIGVLFAINRFF